MNEESVELTVKKFVAFARERVELLRSDSVLNFICLRVQMDDVSREEFHTLYALAEVSAQYGKGPITKRHDAAAVLTTVLFADPRKWEEGCWPSLEAEIRFASLPQRMVLATTSYNFDMPEGKDALQGWQRVLSEFDENLRLCIEKARE